MLMRLPLHLERYENVEGVDPEEQLAGVFRKGDLETRRFGRNIRPRTACVFLVQGARPRGRYALVCHAHARPARSWNCQTLAGVGMAPALITRPWLWRFNS